MSKPNILNSKPKISDYDFIIKIIQFLESKFGISFFITTMDFDTLYKWWEKGIPFKIIEESISNVINRWNLKKRKIYSFSNFSYEVRKNYKGFLELNVSVGKREEEKEEYDKIEKFFNNYPQELKELKKEFEDIHKKFKNKENIDIDNIKEKLLSLFKENNELNLKTQIFLRSLAPELRKPEIEKRYRINYLLNKFKIPDFDI